MEVKNTLSASSPAFSPEQACVAFVSCVVRERWSKVTPWDSFTCHLTSHPTAILHQGLAELHHPLHHSPLHCTCGVFFLLLAVRVPHSIPLPLRMYWLSVSAYQMEAGSPSLPTPGQARIQSEQHQVAKEGERWGFALSVKSLWDNAANINVNAHFLSQKWKFNKATLVFGLRSS